MTSVELFTRDGQFVALVPFFPYQIPPEAICWGNRFFFYHEDDQKYYEGFCHFVPPPIQEPGEHNGEKP